MKQLIALFICFTSANALAFTQAECLSEYGSSIQVTKLSNYSDYYHVYEKDFDGKTIYFDDIVFAVNVNDEYYQFLTYQDEVLMNISLIKENWGGKFGIIKSFKPIAEIGCRLQ
jgi:hypothetical protein